METTYLFHQLRYDPSRSAPMPHRHPFWQTEWIMEGSGQVLYGEKAEVFRKGDVIFIPPHENHRFLYDSGPLSWLSVKYTYDGKPFGDGPSFFRDDTVLSPLMTSLAGALNPMLFPGEHPVELVNSILQSILYYAVHRITGNEKHYSSLVCKAMEYIYRRRGQYVSVAGIAGEFHCSGKYLTTLFRNETGICLKQFIDNQRSEYAAGLLKTSSRSLKEIAMELGFRDIYSFSRFFKNRFGENLTDFRKRVFPEISMKGKRA